MHTGRSQHGDVHLWSGLERPGQRQSSPVSNLSKCILQRHLYFKSAAWSSVFPDSHIPAKTLGFLGSASCFFNVFHISYFFSCFSKNLIFYLMFFKKYQFYIFQREKWKFFLENMSFCKNFLGNNKNPEIFGTFLLQILGKTSKENQFIVHKSPVIQ